MEERSLMAGEAAGMYRVWMERPGALVFVELRLESAVAEAVLRSFGYRLVFDAIYEAVKQFDGWPV